MIKVGDYVTTTPETYEVVNDGFGVLYFKKVGVRQGIVTGHVYSKFETELSRIETQLWGIAGVDNSYAVPSLDDLVKVDNPPDLDGLLNVNGSFPTAAVKLLRSAMQEAWEACGVSLRIEELLKLQDKREKQFLNLWSKHRG